MFYFFKNYFVRGKQNFCKADNNADADNDFHDNEFYDISHNLG